MNTTLQVLDQLADRLRKDDYVVNKVDNGDIVVPFYDCNKVTMMRFTVAFDNEDAFIELRENGEVIAIAELPIELDLLSFWACEHLNRVRP